MTPRTHFAVAFILFAELISVPCLADDALGTAGPIRSFGTGKCDHGYAARQRGECDPPAIASDLPADVRSRQRVARAQQLVRIMRTEPATRELDMAITEDPANISALLLRARFRIPGQPTEAAFDINRVLQLEPDNADALATRAFIMMGQDDEAALRAATRALALAPANVDALWIRSLIAVRLGDTAQAQNDLDRAVTLEPDDRRTRMARAELRLQIGDSVGATNDLNALLALQYDLRALQMRAALLAAAGDDAGALADLNNILGPPGQRTLPGPARPDLVNMYVQRALVLTRRGKPDDAKQDLETIVSLGGNRAILQMQVYLRGHGFQDLSLDGKRSDQLDAALQACFINNACGRGIAIRG
jgi:tetratricopeptide (TPR) repeat protein